MERLTKRTTMGIVGNNASIKNYPLYKVAQYDELDRGITGQCFDKLAEYEDLEEQGLLLRLPFSKETPVYHIENKEVVERKLEHVVISLWLRETTDKDFGGVCFGKNAICAHTDDIGKTAFLMQAEAEQKLKEMESK